MKKSLYLGALALLTLASCASEETVEAPKGNPIDFGKAFINNSTRGGTEMSKDALQNFYVFGYMKDFSGVIFNGQEVTKTDNTWGYINTQYWTPGMAYAFAAVYPYGEGSGVTFTPGTGELPTSGTFGTLTYNNEDGLNDLLYAAQYQSALTSAWPTVNFTFDHMLSRVMITLTNGLANANTTITVKDVTISGAYTSGTLDLNPANAAWDVTGNSKTATYAYTMQTADVAQTKSTASDVFFFIPAKANYTVKFTVVQKTGDVTVENTLTSTVEIDLQRGHSYNLTATLTDETIDPTREPIVFDVVDVNGWTEGTVPPMTF